MDAAGFADAGETAQPVSDDSAGGIEIVPRQGGDLGAAEAFHPWLRIVGITLLDRLPRPATELRIDRKAVTIAKNAWGI